MKLYKFKSLHQIEFTLDILLNERLYCAPYKNLNDPLEGIFYSVIKPPNVECTILDSKTVDDLSACNNNVKICSLTNELSDIRMWSHYANGHEGIAIEITFDGSEEELYEVKYYPGVQKISSVLLGGASPEKVLSIKTKHWEHEKEYRIINKKDHYCVDGKITGLYLGIRISKLHKELLLRAIPNHIPIYDTKLDRKNVTIKPNKKMKTDGK